MIDYNKTLLQQMIDKHGSYEAWQEAVELERDRKGRAMQTRIANKKSKELASIVSEAKAKLGIEDETSKPAPKKKQRSRAGYVYLVKSVTGFYKIGRTVNPHNRLRTFNVKLPFEIEYEHVIQTNNMYALESKLHAQFADKRVNGEWFNLTDSDVGQIKQQNFTKSFVQRQGGKK